MVGSCDVKFPIRLEGLVLTHGQFSRYRNVVCFVVAVWVCGWSNRLDGPKSLKHVVYASHAGLVLIVVVPCEEWRGGLCWTHVCMKFSLFSVWAVSLTSLPHHELALCVHTFWFPFCLFEVWEIWQTLVWTSCKAGVDQYGSKLGILTNSVVNFMEILLVFLRVQHLHKSTYHSLYLFTNHFQTC